MSVAYKDETRNKNGVHSGVYYNAFSEDLFIWDNKHDNIEDDFRLLVSQGPLNQYHASLTEETVSEKLDPYKFGFDFSFNLFDDPEKGIQSISFFLKGDKDRRSIKISRGEERIFIWSFFLALFDVEGWADNQDEYFFIDDPVSSLDEHNIFMTALSIMKLIEAYADDRKIIVTSHHIGFIAILANWLTKGEKAGKYKKKTEIYVLSKNKDGSLSLDNPRKSVFLYHLQLLRVLNQAKENDTLVAYHLVLLRQVLETIASFLGVGRFGYVLEQIGIEDADDLVNMINVLSHENIFTYKSDLIVPNTQDMIVHILEKLQAKYDFVLHEE